MTETSWPFDSGTVDETTWSRMARVWGGTGIVGYPGDTNAQVYGDSSGRQVKIRAGQAQVQGHHWRSDAEVTKAIAANASGNPRIDRIVLRLDPSANTLALAVLEGTPGATPSAPALTQTESGTYELSLATVAVANGASTISAGNVTEERTHIADRGVPTGTLTPFAGTSAPAGYLIADGTAVSRNTYSQLYAAIGTTYGVGDGTTTFNLPDIRGNVVAGADASQTEFNAVGKKGGVKKHTLATSELPAHGHVIPEHGHAAAVHASGDIPAQMSNDGGTGTGTQAARRGTDTGSSAGIRGSNHAHGITVYNQAAYWSQNTGGGAAHQNLQPYIALNYIIKT